MDIVVFWSFSGGWGVDPREIQKVLLDSLTTLRPAAPVVRSLLVSSGSWPRVNYPVVVIPFPQNLILPVDGLVLSVVAVILVRCSSS